MSDGSANKISKRSIPVRLGETEREREREREESERENTQFHPAVLQQPNSASRSGGRTSGGTFVWRITRIQRMPEFWSCGY